MMRHKKTILLLSVFLLALLNGSFFLFAETTFDVAINFGQSDQYTFGISSEVKQAITEELTIDSSIQYLINNEYEATLKATHHVKSWFAAGAGFLLFTHESAMLPAFTASMDFYGGKRFFASISGGIGLNEKQLTKPYLYRAGLESEIKTAESEIDLKLQWQYLSPDSFTRTDYQGDLRIYAVSPDNENIKVCIGLNGGVCLNSKAPPLSLTAGLLIGFDYGTPQKGSSLTFSVTPINDLSLGGTTAKAGMVTWMVSSGMRFAFE